MKDFIKYWLANVAAAAIIFGTATGIVFLGSNHPEIGLVILLVIFPFAGKLDHLDNVGR